MPCSETVVVEAVLHRAAHKAFAADAELAEQGGKSNSSQQLASMLHSPACPARFSCSLECMPVLVQVTLLWAAARLVLNTKGPELQIVSMAAPEQVTQMPRMCSIQLHSYWLSTARVQRL